MNVLQWLILGVGFVLASCSNPVQQVTVFLDENPETLSQWGVIQIDADRLVLGDGVIPYDLNSALFTDFAGKFRTLYLPPGTSATYRTAQALDFPVGSILSKTFYYSKNTDGQLIKSNNPNDQLPADQLLVSGMHLVETRILVHRETGWVALPYLWNQTQTDAVLERTGAFQAIGLQMDDGPELAFTYVVPNTNQCAGCHAVNASNKAIVPIGLAPRHLNKTYPYHTGHENQLVHLSQLGLLQGFTRPHDSPRNVNWQDQTASLDQRALAYLDINCGHCHNPNGAADTSALYLDNPAIAYQGGNSGLCKPPIAAGQGTGGHLFDIVPGRSEKSILWYRMNSTNPAVMMPELGRSSIDVAGVSLIADWINAMSGDCN